MPYNSFLFFIFLLSLQIGNQYIFATQSQVDINGLRILLVDIEALMEKSCIGICEYTQASLQRLEAIFQIQVFIKKI